MKKIIDGKVFNTEKANELGHYYNGFPTGDFKHFTETLYQTKRSKLYFMHGEGGARSPYSEPCGNMTGGGQNIIPLSEEEAFEWACQKVNNLLTNNALHHLTKHLI